MSMSTRTFLVSIGARQCVEVAVSTGGSVRGTQEPKALALFCHAYRDTSIQMLHDGQLDVMKLGHGELTEWTDQNAASMYESVTGEAAPD
jgi:hypothetical protein